MEQATDKTESAEKRKTSRLTFYHANSQGTGAALQFELRMNRQGEDRYDCFFMEMARQKTVAAAGQAQRIPATFDWEKKVTTKLDFFDICAFLMVLEGKAERIGDGRNGLYHEAAGSNTLITLERNGKGSGFYVGISKKTKAGEQAFKGSMLLTDSEALGLRCVFQTGLFFMAFHGSLRR